MTTTVSKHPTSSRNICLFVLTLYAMSINLGIITIYLRQNLPREKLHSHDTPKLGPIFLDKRPAINSETCVGEGNGVKHYIFLVASELTHENKVSHKIYRNLQEILPLFSAKLVLLFTPSTFSTQLRMWCGSLRSKCLISIARGSTLTDYYSAIVSDVPCAKSVVLLSDQLVIDSSFFIRLGQLPPEQLVCLVHNTQCSSTLAYHIPKSFILDSLSKTGNSHTTNISLLANPHAKNVEIVKKTIPTPKLYKR
jgi:hypothetical protein